MDWHAPYLDNLKRAIQQKKISLHPQGLLNPRTRDVCQDYDGFRISICRPQDALDNDAFGNAVNLIYEI